jgi:hypothetical protein
MIIVDWLAVISIDNLIVVSDKQRFQDCLARPQICDSLVLLSDSLCPKKCLARLFSFRPRLKLWPGYSDEMLRAGDG